MVSSVGVPVSPSGFIFSGVPFSLSWPLLVGILADFLTLASSSSLASMALLISFPDGDMRPLEFFFLSMIGSSSFYPVLVSSVSIFPPTSVLLVSSSCASFCSGRTCDGRDAASCTCSAGL